MRNLLKFVGYLVVPCVVKTVSRVVKIVIRGTSCNKGSKLCSKYGNSWTEMPNKNDVLFEIVFVVSQ